MKTRFNTYDIICSVTELQRVVGMRVNQVYDIDNKAYLIRLQQSEEKVVLLIDSGNRFHTTQFEWPKNVAPSGFTMKLRKHLKNKRLEKLTQLGIDRIVEFQFGSGDAAYHVILELYDRGNIILTDCDWTILNVLRPHVEGDKVRFAVKEKYPLDRAKQRVPPPMGDNLKQVLNNSKPGDTLKKILNPNLEYGPGIIDHVLLENGLSGNMRLVPTLDGKGFHIETHLPALEKALNDAEKLLDEASSKIAKGYIIQKKEDRPNTDGDATDFLLSNQEFHPLLYAQNKTQPYAEHDTFDIAVDHFFSTLEGQKIDLKAIQVERDALKKLSNVRKDHDKRLTELQKTQKEDIKKAELITRNQDLVDKAILAVQTALANQLSWEDIKGLVKTAQERKDPIASIIKHLKLNQNHITLHLTDPYDYGDNSDEENEEKLKPMLIDVDLALTAYANARRYYDQKRSAAKKQQKTLESQGKALKSAERKTKQTLKEVQTLTSINKARKTYWFEKFYWFISSENYLVIGGRDQQQNELLVKRYMRPHDIYVHADLSGAASIIIKNPAGGEVPPKTLAEAGQLAVAYSVAWEAKVLTSAWWVRANQVSKSAPTGEYLSTGSFMIRGKKNYLLPTHLMLGFSFMFRLEDSSIERHRDERKVLTICDDTVSQTTTEQGEDEQEIVVSDDDEPSDKENEPKQKLDSISEETPQELITDLRKTDSKPNQSETDIKTSQSDTKTTVKMSGQTKIDTQDEDDNDSDSDSSSEFLDTHVKVDHGTGKVITESRVRTNSETTNDSSKNVVFLGDDKPLSFPKLPKNQGKKVGKDKEVKKMEEKKEENKGGLKRGQKSKLKKIKEKYKDQDEEDRALMLEYFQSAGTPKESKKAQKKNSSGQKNRIYKGPKPSQPPPQILEADESDGEVEEVLEEVETQTSAADIEMLNQLTGTPFPEDEILFSVPVIAPYSVLHNYKFKVKLTPGTGKRGKAAKTAIQVFLRDKNCSPRERDLLRAVKEENVARNFPGKVKLSAPQLHKGKK